MANATRSPRAKGATTTLSEPEQPREQGTGKDYPRPDCNCDAANDISAEHHDWLLSFESRGASGVQEIIEAMERSEGGVPDDVRALGAGLHWTDFSTFVADHNWTDPVAVHNLVDRFTFDLEQLAQLAHADREVSIERLNALEAQTDRIEKKVLEVLSRRLAKSDAVDDHPSEPVRSADRHDGPSADDELDDEEGPPYVDRNSPGPDTASSRHYSAMLRELGALTGTEFQLRFDEAVGGHLADHVRPSVEERLTDLERWWVEQGDCRADLDRLLSGMRLAGGAMERITEKMLGVGHRAADAGS